MDKDFWEDRYKTNKTSWDLGEISTPLKAYFDQLEDKSIRILIPGCGNGYEAIYLWENGFENIFILDIVEEVVSSFKKSYPLFPTNQILCQDFFSHSEQYDLVVEQFFFARFNQK